MLHLKKHLTTKEKKRLNFWWHKTQYLEHVSSLFTGYFLCLYSTSVLHLFSMLFLIASVFWIIYNGFINIALDRKFFHRSTTSSSWFDLIAYWPVQILMLILAILINLQIIKIF